MPAPMTTTWAELGISLMGGLLVRSALVSRPTDQIPLYSTRATQWYAIKEDE